jgi:AcrR family transcriptional regulator
LTVAIEPKVRARYAAKRDAIMAAATTVFADQGLSGFTLAAVAKRMDLHPVSLTYYFKRKEDLAAAVLYETIDRYGEMLSLAEAGATPPERLRTLVTAYFETRARVALGQEIPLAPFNEIALIEGEQHAPLMEAFHTIYIRIAQLLKSEEMPWMTRLKRQALARLVVNALTWSDSWIGGYAPEDYPRVAARMAEIMLDGLGRSWPQLELLPLGTPSAENDEVTRDRFLVAATS